MDETTGAKAMASPAEAEITLGLLSAVHEDSAVTQRRVASDLGIALGLANAYLKRCVKKGLIKVKQVPPNRYAYYLTPQGFAEKTRLTTEYLSGSLTFFRRARSQCSDLFALCADNGWRRVALAGAGDLAEIASLCAGEHPVELLGVVDPHSTTDSILGRPVLAEIGEAQGVDAVIVTALRDAQGVYDALCRVMPAERVLAPPFLHVSTRGPNAEAAA